MFNEPSIVNADDLRLVSLITAAKRRVVFLAPAVSEGVARALADKWTELGPTAVQVILDVDPEVYRLGYGALGGLKLLWERASSLQTEVRQHPGIRIGLLAADEAILVYSPTPLLVEAGSSRPDHPNAFQLGGLPLDGLRHTGLGGNGGEDPTIGREGVDLATIQKLENDLKSNPPVKFDLARKVRVFTSKFQFVELEMTGIYISRKRVPIPSSLVGLAQNRDIQSQFHAYFNLVNQAKLEVKVDGNRTLTEKSLHEKRQEIVRRFLIPLKGYGMVVLRANKEKLLEAFEQLKKDVANFRKGVEGDLERHMKGNIEALAKALFPAVKRNPPDEYTKYYGASIPEDKLRESLKNDIEWAFGQSNDLVQGMKVALVFKDLTYESLTDGVFLEVARTAIPGMTIFHEEFDAAKATSGDAVTK